MGDNCQLRLPETCQVSVLSRPIKVNGLEYFSGQCGGTTGAIEEQTARALDSLKTIAQAAGMSMGDIVSTTVYLKDVDDFARMNAVYAGYFKDKPPARATVQVARLSRDSLIQISAIAAKSLSTRSDTVAARELDRSL